MDLKKRAFLFRNAVNLFYTLYQHRRLSLRRSFSYKQNRAAKFVLGLVGLIIVIYLMLLAVILSFSVNENKEITPIEFLLGISPFILIIDFFVRFIVQQTPAQLIKPYILLPISRYSCINSFIISSLFSLENFI